jgi:hypothetical protein
MLDYVDTLDPETFPDDFERAVRASIKTALEAGALRIARGLGGF